MRELILHIGANKTGSSAIQQALRAHHSVLTEQNYVIPDRYLGTTTSISGEHVFTLEQYIKNGDNEGLRSRIDGIFDNVGDDKKVILSAENLSNVGRHTIFENFSDNYNLKIIIYIRRQDELITSSWQQWHSKVERDFNAWLISALKRLGHWEQIIDDWESVAGPGSVNVRVFERAEFPNGNVVADFMQQLQIDHDKLSLDTPKLANPSFNDAITSLVSGNKFIFKDANDNDFYRYVQNITGDHFIKQKKVSLISPHQRTHIIEFYREENERVCQKFFPKRPRLFEPVDHSKYSYLNDLGVMNEQLRFLATMLYAQWKNK